MSSVENAGLSAKDIVEILFRRRHMLLLVLGGVMAMAVAVTVLSHKIYQSETKILVQNARENVVITTEKAGPTNQSNDVTEQEINSELEIIHSRDVLDNVVDPGWNKTPTAQRTQDEIKRHDKLIGEFEKNLGADAGRKSNVITITYMAKSPIDAQDTLKRLVASYLGVQRGLQRPTGASEFFSSEAERYRNAWNDATQRFVEFQQKNNIVSLPDQETALQKDILLAQSDMRAMDGKLTELQGRLAASSAQLQSQQQRQLTITKSTPNLAVQELSTLVVTLENKHTTLLNQFKPDSREVRENETQLKQTRAALDNAIATSGQETSTDVNPVWQKLSSDRSQDEVARNALVRQRAEAQRQLDTMQKQLGSIEQLTMQYNLMKSTADELKENYTLYVQKREQAQIEDAMDARKLLNVTVAEQPTLSYLQVKPKPVTNIALGFVTAVFLAAVLIYLSELGRRTIQTPRELDVATSNPVLATVPMLSGDPDLAGAYEDGIVSHYADFTAGDVLMGSLHIMEEDLV